MAMQVQDGLFLTKCRYEPVSIPLEDILYFESRDRLLNIYLRSDKSYTCYGNLKDLESMLPEADFIRCHKSYVISLGSIVGITPKEVRLISGITLPIGEKYAEQLSLTKDKLIKRKNVDVCTEEWGLLKGIQGDLRGAMIYIHKQEAIVLGRDCTKSDITIANPIVSRQHCTVTYLGLGSGYQITDFSANGTEIICSMDAPEQSINLDPDQDCILSDGMQFAVSDTDVFQVGIPPQE